MSEFYYRTSDEDAHLMLSDREHQYMDAFSEQLSHRFDLTEDDLAVVLLASSPESRRLFLAHTSPTGLDLGEKHRSWNDIFKAERDDIFTFTYAGDTIDTRQGMTQAVYEAVRQRQRGAGLQFDSRPATLEDGPDGRPWTYRWTNTMLTGERPSVSDHKYAIEDRFGKLAIRGCLRSTDSPVLLFRPAIEIPTDC